MEVQEQSGMALHERSGQPVDVGGRAEYTAAAAEAAGGPDVYPAQVLSHGVPRLPIGRHSRARVDSGIWRNIPRFLATLQ